jgi:hypothetical protein
MMRSPSTPFGALVQQTLHEVSAHRMGIVNVDKQWLCNSRLRHQWNQQARPTDVFHASFYIPSGAPDESDEDRKKWASSGIKGWIVTLMEDQRPVIVVSPKHMMSIPFLSNGFHVDSTNAGSLEAVERIVSTILDIDTPRPPLVIVAAGVAAKVIISKLLYKAENDGWGLIDIGTALDPYAGIISRDYHRGDRYCKWAKKGQWDLTKWFKKGVCGVPSQTPTVTSYVLFSIQDHRSLGGWGDRMRGLWWAMDVSKRTGRQLIVDWDEFQQVFDVNPVPTCDTTYTLTCEESTQKLRSLSHTCLQLPYRGTVSQCVSRQYDVRFDPLSDETRLAKGFVSLFRLRQEYKRILEDLPTNLTCAQLRTGGSLGFRHDYVFSDRARSKCVYKHIVHELKSSKSPSMLLTDSSELYQQFVDEVPQAVTLEAPIEHIDRKHSLDGFVRVALEINLLQRCHQVRYHVGSGYLRNSLFLVNGTILTTEKWQEGACLRTKSPTRQDSSNENIINLKNERPIVAPTTFPDSHPTEHPLLSKMVVDGSNLGDHEIVVSFDDGPNNVTTPILLDTLKRHGVHATFFQVGVNVNNPELTHRIIDEGHIIGSHTDRHVHLTHSKDVLADISQVKRTLEQYLGETPHLIRPPYGEINGAVSKVLKENDYLIMKWNADSIDWTMKRPEQVLTKVKSLLSGRTKGTLLLMHEYTWTTEAAEKVLPAIKAMGFTFKHPVHLFSKKQQKWLWKVSECPNAKHMWCPHLERVLQDAPGQTTNYGNNFMVPDRVQSLQIKKVPTPFPFWDTYKTTTEFMDDGTTFVWTGDIGDMWIRDSSAQVMPYLDMARTNRTMQRLIGGLLKRQAMYIEVDPYANSYRKTEQHFPDDKRLGRGGYVATRNFELDSGCYFIRLLYHYVRENPSFDYQPFRKTILVLKQLWETEQHHEERSPYRYVELPRNGMGSETVYTGMVWSGFRPSDDPCTFGYHIPDNLFLLVALQYVSELFPDIHLTSLSNDIQHGIQQYGSIDGRYCYEVNGIGGCKEMDDANVPSLLSLPYLDKEGRFYDKEMYVRTRSWILSKNNPYYYEGSAASGIGSPHTPMNHIWPMSIIMEGLTDPSVAQQKIRLVESTTAGTGNMHESFHKNDPTKYTRKHFAWANALYSELKRPPFKVDNYLCDAIEVDSLPAGPPERVAYVWWTSDTVYTWSILVAMTAMRDTGTHVPFVLITTVALLPEQGIAVQALRARVVTTGKVQDIKHPQIRYAANKLFIFNLTEYDRIIYMDGDSMPMQNIDYLFNLPQTPLAAPCSYWEPDQQPKITAWFMVIQPNAGMYQTLMTRIQSISRKETEMDVINYVLKDRMMILPSYYGMLNSEWEVGDNVYRVHGQPDIVYQHVPIVHFTAKDKPWHHPKGSFQGNQWDQPFRSLHQKWWALRESL